MMEIRRVIDIERVRKLVDNAAEKLTRFKERLKTNPLILPQKPNNHLGCRYSKGDLLELVFLHENASIIFRNLLLETKY